MKVEPVGLQTEQNLTQAAPPEFTIQDKRDELAREINLRHVVYPGMIRSGKLTQAKADRQIAVMRAIWQEYADKCDAAKAEREPQLPLGEPGQPTPKSDQSTD